MIDSATFARYAEHPSEFRADLTVDVDGVARRFGQVMDRWQLDDFTALDSALLRAVGRTDTDCSSRAYLERPRGHSKTTDLAITCCYALAFAVRPIRGYAFAADRDQAALLKDAMATIVRLNPWLANILDVQKNLVANIAQGHPGADSKLEIFTSDVGSSYGILPDLIIADELVHWQGDGSLWHSLLSSAAKRSGCFLVTISNAGFADSWQWKVREAARTDSAWYFSRLDGPQASWLSPARLEEQRRMLPPVAYARLWLNEWSTGGGDALSRADIDAAFKPDLHPMPSKQPGWDFVAGLDLGVSRDCSALVVLGIRHANVRDRDKSQHGRIRLAATKLWKPPTGGKVELQKIENELLTLHAGYTFKSVGFDPWQAAHMSQRLALSQIPMFEITQTGKNLQSIATTLIEAFADHRVDLYEEPNLRRDLYRLRIEERQYGFRLTSPRDERGHGDTASAFGYALLAATTVAAKMKRLLRVGCWGDGAWAGSIDDTPEDRIQAFAKRRQEYEQEMTLLARGGSDDTLENLFRGTRRLQRRT